MVDNEAVYKVLFDGLMNAIDDIETKNYVKARMTLIQAQALALDIILLFFLSSISASQGLHPSKMQRYSQRILLFLVFRLCQQD